MSNNRRQNRNSNQSGGSGNSQTELAALKDRIYDADKLIQTRIESFDQRTQLLLSSIETTKNHVDQRATIFGIASPVGLVAGFVFLLVVIYVSAKPIAEDVADTTAKNIDWEGIVEATAKDEVKKLVTPEALAGVVNEKTIQLAAEKVINTPEFSALLNSLVQKYVPHNITQSPDFLKAVDALVQKYIREQVQSDEALATLVKNSVARLLDDAIANSEAFKKKVEEQLASEQERVRKMLNATPVIEASNRDELITRLKDALVRAGAANRRFRPLSHLSKYLFF